VPSIVIAAHNEEAVIGACLDALARQASPSLPLQIVVCANGCTDRTVAIASREGVVVLDLAEPGKSAAINAGDDVATEYPRIYLDADIIAPPDAIAALTERLASGPPVLVAVPRRRLDVAGRPWPVRAYFAINERLPAFKNGLFGRGMIALSLDGRRRFEAFPTLIADDLFLDSQFSDDEKAEVASVEVVVAAPHTTRALLQRLIRVRRGNEEMRRELGDRARPSNRWAWLRSVVLPHPHLIVAAVPYVVITLTAEILARRSPPEDGGWGRDDTTRRSPLDQG